MTTIETKIARAKELAEKATPGPLVVNCGESITIRAADGLVATVTHLTLTKRRDIREVEANAQLFAEARTLLPDLASECERLREENAILQSQVDNSDANIEQMRMIWKPRAVKAEAEVSRLRALVESAPHASNCDSRRSTMFNHNRDCTCWKRNLTQPTP